MFCCHFHPGGSAVGVRRLPPSSNIHHTSMVPLGCLFLNWTLASISFSFILAICGGGGPHTDTGKGGEGTRNEKPEKVILRAGVKSCVGWRSPPINIYVSRDNCFKHLRQQGQPYLWFNVPASQIADITAAKMQLSGVCVCVCAIYIS